MSGTNTSKTNKAPAHALTFADLEAEHAKRATEARTNSGSAANEVAALRRFRATLGLNAGSPLAPTMTVGFDEALRQFEAAIRASRGRNGRPLADATILSYRSRLRSMHDIAETMTTPDLGRGGFAEAVRVALDEYLKRHPGASFSSVAQRCGMGRHTLRRWYGGERPVRWSTTLASLPDLERELGVPEGALASLTFACKSSRQRTRSGWDARDPKEFLAFVQYCPSTVTAFPAKVATFLRAHEKYKTGLHAGRNRGRLLLERARGSRWRLIDGEAATACIFRSHLSLMVGWLLLPKTLEGARAYVRANLQANAPNVADEFLDKVGAFFVGKGMCADEITPCHLVDPELVAEFIQWRLSRSVSGRPSGGQRGYIEAAAQLLRPKFGYLTQCVEHAWDYLGWQPADPSTPDGLEAYRGMSRRWSEITEDIHRQIMTIAATVDGDHRERNPHVTLGPILDFPNPLEVVDRIIAAHGAQMPQGTLEGDGASVALACWCRDQALLRTLAANPLRNRNLRQMRYFEDNTGNLYKKNNVWRLRFASSDFKNERGAAKHDYDVGLPAELQPYFDLYIAKARPVLIRKRAMAQVFVTQYGTPYTSVALSKQVLRITAQFLPAIVDAVPFRTHAFRHIVATSYLRHNPRDYLTVSDILHDDIATILAVYARRSPDDGLRRYSTWREQTSTLPSDLPPLGAP